MVRREAARLCVEGLVVFAADRCVAAEVIEEAAIFPRDLRGLARILCPLLKLEVLLHKEVDLTEVDLVV